MNKLLLIVTVGWWLGIGLILIEHNLAPFGHSKLNWNNPSRTAAHFTWHQRPTVQDGQVIIPPGQTRRFAVTLPRGYMTGELSVSFVSPSQSALNVLAASVPGKTVRTQATDSPGILNFVWSDLTARGHKFDFALSSSATADTIVIQNIKVIARRQ